MDKLGCKQCVLVCSYYAVNHKNFEVSWLFGFTYNIGKTYLVLLNKNKNSYEIGRENLVVHLKSGSLIHGINLREMMMSFCILW